MARPVNIRQLIVAHILNDLVTKYVTHFSLLFILTRWQCDWNSKFLLEKQLKAAVCKICQ